MKDGKFLIVVDMQNDFINGILGSEEAETIVPTVTGIINDMNGLVDKIYITKDIHAEITYSELAEDKFIPIHCNTAEGQDLHPRIKEAIEGKNIQYMYKNTFGSIALAEELSMHLNNDNDYAPDSTIYIVGLCTDICVISNALMIRAFCPKANIVVYENACAGSSKENHEDALRIMRANCIKTALY